jgi:putative FmdB family regulatory protein
MPTYDYECTSCKHTFEAVQSMADDALEECPKCGKKIRRLIGGGMGIIFKGSGFYSTDNRSGGKDSKTSSGDSAPSTSKPANSGESSGSKDTSSAPPKKKEPAKTKK